MERELLPLKHPCPRKSSKLKETLVTIQSFFQTARSGTSAYVMYYSATVSYFKFVTFFKFLNLYFLLPSPAFPGPEQREKNTPFRALHYFGFKCSWTHHSVCPFKEIKAWFLMWNCLMLFYQGSFLMILIFFSLFSLPFSIFRVCWV